MKILFVSHKWQARTGESCARALRELGCEVELAWAKIGAVSPLAKAYYWAKRTGTLGGGLRAAEMRFLNGLIVKKAARFKPDIAIINAGGEVSPETLKSIKRTGALLVCWAGDDPTHYRQGPYYMEGIRLYDHYFLIDKSWYTKALRQAGAKKCSILQYGVDPEIYRPLTLSGKDARKYSSDVCHLGTIHTDRVELLTGLLDYDISLWGGTSFKILKKMFSLSPGLAAKMKSGVVQAQVTNRIYNASKICLNIQHLQVKGAHSNKTFEITGSGAFLLSSFNDPLHESFDRDELLSFKDLRELRALIDYFLRNENERKKIALKAHKRTLARHLYRHRLARMLEECGFRV